LEEEKDEDEMSEEIEEDLCEKWGKKKRNDNKKEEKERCHVYVKENTYRSTHTHLHTTLLIHTPRCGTSIRLDGQSTRCLYSVVHIISGKKEKEKRKNGKKVCM
jgi:hypothetical protein